MDALNIGIMIIACVVSYLLGGLSIARLMTKKTSSGGIVSQGSGNPGTMNMLRNHGLVMGLFTLFCDALKGAAPALFGLLYFDKFGMDMAYIALYLFGLCAVVGHIFPIYYKFKGGKGIATTLGVFMVADPITSCILFCILIVTLYFIKISSIVSMLFITINAIVQFFRDYSQDNWVVIILLVVMVLLDIIAHRKNFERLVENKENAADLQEGLEKDIQKLKDKKQRKLNRNEQKQGRIEERYERKIEKKHRVVNKKIEKINSKNSESVSNPINEEKSKTSK